ncbi:MAG: penicillin-binding protein [Actinomycetota bacterium]|nr:penicillin-binding protein [Actinomycetota bacterium]
MRVVGRSFALLVVSAAVVPLVATGTILAALLFLPLPASLPAAKPGVEAAISRIYDINGNEIGVFRQFDSTKPIERADIPEVLKQAVVAGEDRRFYSHSGVDVWGTFRALWADVRNQELVQGGSTITQQYVKNAYVGSERSFTRKVREAILASQLDRQVDKDEILFRYLERIYLGEGAYGVGAAAETYFHKPVSDLSLSESALLAGLIPAPSRYEPRGNPALAEERRRFILDAMLGEGMITPDQHAEALAQPVWLATPGAVPPEGGATVVHPREQAETAYPYFLDYLQRHLAERYGEDAVYQQGLRIYTTLDRRLQEEAERSVGETLDGTDPPLEASLVAVEPLTGFVKALVGGRDFASSRVNLALGASGGGTGRQPGSAFKPFVLAQALEEGIAPTRTYSGASPMEVGGTSFQNFGGSSYGRIDLRSATRQSVNTAYVQLLQDVGVPETMALAKRMGISSSDYQEGVHALSVALGSLSVSPLDMSSAFGVFAARGERAEPTPVVRVLDAEGNVLEDNAEPERTRVLEEITADNVNEILEGVLQAGGTAGDNGIDRPAAGKTGTAQGHSDAWFVGYTPTLSTSVWMGYADAPRPLVGIKGVRAVTGGSLPAATWESFMRGALADVAVTDFTEPAPITDLAEILRRRARGGFDVRALREPRGTDSGAYVEELPAPVADPPPATTTTLRPGRDDQAGTDLDELFDRLRRERDRKEDADEDDDRADEDADESDEDDDRADDDRADDRESGRDRDDDRDSG